MPRVWIVVDEAGLRMDTQENENGLPVDMNASLFRQIKHSIRQYEKFQLILSKFYMQALTSPDTIRRVR